MHPVARFVLAAIAGAGCAAPAGAFDNRVPQGGLPSASTYSATLLPERAGVVPWKTLAQVEPVKQGNRMVPSFAKDILALDRTSAKVQGFMIPLDVGDRQKRFLLTAVPPHCSFCLPAGPDGMVEVVAKTPVRYTFDPIVVAGRFDVLKDDPGGLLYRLSDAEQVDVVRLSPAAAAQLGLPQAAPPVKSPTPTAN